MGGTGGSDLFIVIVMVIGLNNRYGRRKNEVSWDERLS
jgi:hypothetical protein